jgi:electron transfer flavoprotein alpha subunit
MSILVYVDQFQGSAKPVSWEILGKARELAGTLGGTVSRVVVGHERGRSGAGGC